MRLSLSSCRAALAALGVCALVASPCATAAIAVQSEFSTDTEGWLLFGDATTSAPRHVATGGNPGGYAEGTDQTIGGVWYWQAPAKFLGDRSLSFGQSLSFDLRMRGSGPLFDSTDLLLSGGGLALHLDLSPVPQAPAWTTYSVTLDQSTPWRVGSATGQAATEQDLRMVLGDLDALRIRGEFITGSDVGDLDNVILTAVPEPRAYALFAAGLCAVGWAGRRRRKRTALA